MAPAISAIIHFLNSERYLRQAIQSVFWQTFQDWELVLVDGGSTDRSVDIAEEYAAAHPDRIRSFRHTGPECLGIFSSRIWGARESRGPVLAHLDSDDEWDPRFLERQYALHQTHFTGRPGLVYSPMVYYSDDVREAISSHVQRVPSAGVHEPPSLVVPFASDYGITPGNTAVVVSREIILEAAELIGTADEGAVEDQFLWSFVALRHPIYVSPEPLTRYRQWRGSTSAAALRSSDDRRGRADHLTWLASYLIQHCDAPLGEQMAASVTRPDQSTAAEPKTPPTWTPPPPEPDTELALARARSDARHRMAHGTAPLSELWGSDRGRQIHRLFIDHFMAEFRSDIRGHCLEFQDPMYAHRFGGDAITKLDILHVAHGNPLATLVADLSQPNDLPDDTFDAIICTHVLHVIADVRAAIGELQRVLKPGGVLLVAVPAVSMADPALFTEYWRFTPQGLERLLAESFGSENVTIRAYGNSLTTAGDLRGLVTHEFTDDELAVHDRRFALEVCGRAVKK